MKKHGFTIVLKFVLVIGLSLLLYPTVANLWNSFHQSGAIASYTSEVADVDDDTYREVWDSAIEYNARLAERGNLWILNDEQEEEYRKQLSVSKTGIMGYIEIPAIDCKLPIYHGTDETVLQVGVGHVDGSSLPVGGVSTHCVLSGHRGLPSAELFTDLDKLSKGDIFMLQVLDETLTYEVEKILIVQPSEVDALKIEEGRDLCTLVTCTPYGVNTHRILVIGSRIENVENIHTVRVTADAVQLDTLLVALFVGLVFLLIVWVVWIISLSIRRRGKNE